MYETGSNKLYIDGIDRTTESNGRLSSLIYGVFDNTVSNQFLQINGNLYVTNMTNDESPSNIVYYNTTTKQLTYGSKPSGGVSAYSGITYNTINGSSITNTGTTTINFSTTDVYNVNISGNTISGITFDFSNEIIGKTLTMVITNTGVGNTTSCIFNPTTCKTFGSYDSSKTNAVSVLCVKNTNPKYWVVIANT